MYPTAKFIEHISRDDAERRRDALFYGLGIYLVLRALKAPSPVRTLAAGLGFGLAQLYLGADSATRPW